MKKTILTLAVLAITGVASIGTVEAKTAKKTTTTATEATTATCDKESEGGCCQDKPEMKCRMKPQDPKKACPFESLNLTDEQKEQLKSLRESERAERQVSMHERMANDSVMMAAREQQKRDYLKKVKAILTEDQYIQFLEDNYVKAQGQDQRGGRPCMRKMEMRQAPEGMKK